MTESSPGHDVIAVGASAGGVEALMHLVGGLPKDLPAAVFVVLHVPPSATSVLPAILERAGPLPAFHPRDRDPIRPGSIHVAPPDCHLLVHPGYVRVVRGPRENRQRPAVDPLFRTAARAYGGRVVGVVLSGTLDDGTAGLSVIKAGGGVAVVQDPAEALFPSMPRSAAERVAVDHVVPVREIGPLLSRLAREPAVTTPDWQSSDLDLEAAMAELDPTALQQVDRPGTPSPFGCPECGGVLWEQRDGDVLRFRCRVGHAMSADTLLEEQTQALETSLWMALRALEEKAALAERLEARSRQQGHATMIARFGEQATEVRGHAEVVRRLLLQGRSQPARQGGTTNGGNGLPRGAAPSVVPGPTTG